MPAPAPRSWATLLPVATSAPSTETLMVPSAVVSALMLPRAHAGSCPRGAAGRGPVRVSGRAVGTGRAGPGGRETDPDGLERRVGGRLHNLAHKKPGRLCNGAPPARLNLDARVRPRVKGRQHLASADRRVDVRAAELRPQKADRRRPGIRGRAGRADHRGRPWQAVAGLGRGGAYRSGANKQSQAAASWSRRCGLSLMSVGSVAAVRAHTLRPLSVGTTRTAGGTLGPRRAAAISSTGITASSARASASASSANVYELQRLALAAISRSVATRLDGATRGSPHPADCGWPSTPIVATHSACAKDQRGAGRAGRVSGHLPPMRAHRRARAVLPRKRRLGWSLARHRRPSSDAAPGAPPSAGLVRIRKCPALPALRPPAY